MDVLAAIINGMLAVKLFLLQQNLQFLMGMPANVGCPV